MLLIPQATTRLYSWLYSYWYNKRLCSIPPLIQHYYVTLIPWYSKLLRYHSYWYNTLICYYSLIDTTSYYVTILLLIQQIYITIPQLIQQSIRLPFSHWYSKLLVHILVLYNNLWQHYTSIDTANYLILDTAISTTTIQQGFSKLSYDRTILLIQNTNNLFYNWYNNLNVLIQQPIMSTYYHCYSKLLRYYTPIDIASY